MSEDYIGVNRENALKTAEEPRTQEPWPEPSSEATALSPLWVDVCTVPGRLSGTSERLGWPGCGSATDGVQRGAPRARRDRCLSACGSEATLNC